MEFPLLRFLLLILLLSSGISLGGASLSYKPGHCEVSMSNLIREVVQSELHAVLNPQFRYSNEKFLQFDLYTPKNPSEHQVLRTGDKVSLKRSNFNVKWPVRFSIHGWMGNSLTCSNAAIKDAYLSRGDFNIIIVDWSVHALDISYTRISAQLPTIGRYLLKFIDFLHSETGIEYEEIYLIGHSAGAHIAGWAGKLLKPQRFGAIMALDPAGLAQLGLSESQRLAPNDALYVESLHSDIALLGNPSTSLSQAAFFSNYGLAQPQCPNATAAEFDFTCDHFASLYYFAESIRSPSLFGAIRCERSGGGGPPSQRGDDDFDRFSCNCHPARASGACPADVFFGGEPLVAKSGVYYFSTRKSPDFGYGSDVYIKKRQPAKMQQSRRRITNSLIQRAIYKV